MGTPRNASELIRWHLGHILAASPVRRAGGEPGPHRDGTFQEGGWIFATEVGDPINPRTDWDEWKRLLNRAGIRDGRLHDARHTAATALLLLGVSERTIMGLMGWSNTAMTHRYAHMVDPIRDDVARRIDGLLWAESDAVEDGK